MFYFYTWGIYSYLNFILSPWKASKGLSDKWKAYNISFLKFKICDRELSNPEGPGGMYVSYMGLNSIHCLGLVLQTQHLSPEELFKYIIIIHIIKY